MTDVVMPGMNGRQLAEQLKALLPGAQSPLRLGLTDDAIVRPNRKALSTRRQFSPPLPKMGPEEDRGHFPVRRR